MAGLRVVILIVQTLLYAFLLNQINHTQPSPYMDEIFHVPQTGNYCVYNFSHWDTKITTLPGLYVTSTVLLKLCSFVASCDLSALCTTTWLRSINLLFSLANLIIIWEILKKLRLGESSIESTAAKSKSESTSETKVSPTKKTVAKKDSKGLKVKSDGNNSADKIEDELAIESLTISHFPVLFFISHLYYTDAGALFFVLVMYLSSLKGNHFMAASLGLASFVFRQTNIIWVIFIAGLVVLRFLEKRSDIRQCQVVQLIPLILRTIFGNFIPFLVITIPYIAIFVLFIVFLVVNEGIVVGDRSSHVAVLNAPQILYFTAFTLFMSSPLQLDFHTLTAFSRSLKTAIRKPLLLILLFITAILMCLSIYKLTYVHPYLLADNRHYPFYVWKKLYERHWTVRYLLAPVYIYGAFTITYNLGHRGYLWTALYMVCTAVVLVPQQLLEFRYFIIPYVIFRLNIRQPSVNLMLFELFLYISINAFTFYMFIFRPFYWTHENSIQRFMW